jgi:6-phosphogluconolactonase (cycloisomerase 2 family)
LLYRFDASNGTLAQLSETPFNEFPVGLLFSCNGTYLAAVHNADNMASVFSISGSNLQELSGSPVLLNKATTGQGVVACP